ncbi:unnamed protein product [Caenorhabditis auriculariae]|uniref:Uncharacterized protein n=1 Tax=Caenorhabditis auriculariae TaxID=2777116 RepID=A0A8S1GUQ4_9PELO|nr:unnamed protein product [Caenorhabditis auriculariae]
MRPENGEGRCLKCVFVGNAAVGKTSLIVSYTTNGYSDNYVPTAFDNFSVIVLVDKKPIRLQLHDTAGQSSFDSLRPLCYSDADVFIIVYSVVDEKSFEDVRFHWWPEISKRSPGTRVILVGTQTDLRWQARQSAVSRTRAKVLAQQMGAEHFECSALTQHNLKEMFDAAILAGLEGETTRRNEKRRTHSKSAKIKERVQRLFNITRNLI